MARSAASCGRRRSDAAHCFLKWRRRSADWTLATNPVRLGGTSAVGRDPDREAGSIDAARSAEAAPRVAGTARGRAVDGQTVNILAFLRRCAEFPPRYMCVPT